MEPPSWSSKKARWATQARTTPAADRLRLLPPAATLLLKPDLAALLEELSLLCTAVPWRERLRSTFAPRFAPTYALPFAAEIAMSLQRKERQEDPALLSRPTLL